jgi:hypothetical protein
MTCGAMLRRSSISREFTDSDAYSRFASSVMIAP